MALASELSWIFTLGIAIVGIKFLREFSQAMVAAIDKLTGALTHEVRRLDRHEERLEIHDRIFGDHEVRLRELEVEYYDADGI